MGDYTKVGPFINESTPDLDADNMNQMDQGIFDAHEKVDNGKATATHNITVDADYTLTSDQNTYGRIVITDTGVILTASRNIIVGIKQRRILVQNDTAQILTFKTSAGTGVAIGPSSTGDIYSDGTNIIISDEKNARLDRSQTFTAPQKSVAHDYGVVGATKTISLADGSGQNYSLTNTSGVNLTLTASDFNVDSTGWIEISNVGTGSDTISFDSTFDGENAPDLSAVGTYVIGYKSKAAKLTLFAATSE